MYAVRGYKEYCMWLMVQAKDKGKVWKGKTRQQRPRGEREMQKNLEKGQSNIKDEEKWRISKEFCETHAPSQEIT